MATTPITAYTGGAGRGSVGADWSSVRHLASAAGYLAAAIAAVGAWFTRRGEHARIRDIITDLTPLWRTLTSAVPGVTLDADTTGLDHDLYRMVIEIRDAQLALRDVTASGVATWARSAADRYGIPPGRETDLIVEAAELAAALAHTPAPPQCAASPARAPTNNTASGPATGSARASKAAAKALPCAGSGSQPAVPDIGTEARWLIMLAHALTTHPIIGELLAGDMPTLEPDHRRPRPE